MQTRAQQQRAEAWAEMLAGVPPVGAAASVVEPHFAGLLLPEESAALAHAITPEDRAQRCKNLFSAVLAQAVHEIDAAERVAAPLAAKPHSYRLPHLVLVGKAALAWIKRGPMFEYVCLALGLDAHRVRKAILARGENTLALRVNAVRGTAVSKVNPHRRKYTFKNRVPACST